MIFLVTLSTYIIGSIPFGLIFTSFAGLGDVRKIGSGNIGATNVLRTGNRKIAIATLLCDSLKGLVPTYFFYKYKGFDTAAIIGFTTIIGHIFPIWLNFKGGKGVATALGVFFALNIFLGIGTVLVWFFIARIWKISSLAALIAFLFSPFLSYILFKTSYALENLIYFSVMSAGIILFTHHQNIKRLINKEEKVF